MTSKQFVIRTVTTVIIILFIFTTCNILINDFGLWGERTEIRIWTKEKTSKHLLSYKYIPHNFNGLLIGASVAANLDTRDIKSHKIYNLSMEGANTTELKVCVDKVLDRGKIDVLIVSLYPYLTKNSGIKGSEINKQEYWGSVFSTLPIQLLFSKMKSKFLLKGKDKFAHSEWGYNDINVHVNIEEFYSQVENYNNNLNKNITVDKNAITALGQILENARKKDIKIVAYFHPIFYKRLNDYNSSGAWMKYKQEITSLFQQDDILYDMNNEPFNYIRMNKENYTGLGHLSKKGASEVVKVINEHLNSKSNN